MKDGIWEYRIESGPKSVLQTKLNQWRHDYDVIVLSVAPIILPPNNDLEFVMVLERKLREKSVETVFPEQKDDDEAF